jgi:dihydrofolate synthase / folylpolyglutamate synthase
VSEFTRVEAELLERGFTRMVFDLSRIEELLDALGSPQRAYPAVHLTGTNGKTSTARMIDSLLRAHGIRTGRYTSPHLETVRERISIDGDPIDADRFVAAYREVAPVAEMLDAHRDETLTFFDVTTAMAFAAFADAPVDVAVVEVGLGGAEDSTNVLHAGVCVITPIGLDHTEWLGDTISDIAHAKAGIIHRGATVVTAAQEHDAARAILQRCSEVGATVAREGSEFAVLRRAMAVGGQVLTLQGTAGTYEEVLLPVHGAHQAQNAATALAATEVLLGASDRRLHPDLVRAGFADLRVPGRLERVRSAPTILLDAAHNPHGMTATATALAEEFDFHRLVAVVAVLGDKDVSGLLEPLEPLCDAVVVTRNSSSRAMPAARLGALAEEVFGADRVTVAASLPDAVEVAVAIAEEGVDAGFGGVGIVITGSVFTVADARRLLAR